jgi:uncharacterized membrane protein YhaH (DUF805 family)
MNPQDQQGQNNNTGPIIENNNPSLEPTQPQTPTAANYPGSVLDQPQQPSPPTTQSTDPTQPGYTPPPMQAQPQQPPADPMAPPPQQQQPVQPSSQAVQPPASVPIAGTQQPGTAAVGQFDNTSWLGMSFADAIKNCFSKYATFSGRASRSEYWNFYLFNLGMSRVASTIDSLIFGTGLNEAGVISSILSLALLLPALSVFVRRLHDTGRSGWWWFLIPTIVGIIPLIIWLATKGSNEPNKYGPPVTPQKPTTA